MVFEVPEWGVLLFGTWFRDLKLRRTDGDGEAPVGNAADFHSGLFFWFDPWLLCAVRASEFHMNFLIFCNCGSFLSSRISPKSVHRRRSCAWKCWEHKVWGAKPRGTVPSLLRERPRFLRPRCLFPVRRTRRRWSLSTVMSFWKRFSIDVGSLLRIRVWIAAACKGSSQRVRWRVGTAC